MSLKNPDIIEHNNPNLPAVDGASISNSYTIVTSIAERDTIPLAKRGRLVEVTGEGLFRYKGNDYTDLNWTNTQNWRTLIEGDSFKLSYVNADFTLDDSHSNTLFITDTDVIITLPVTPLKDSFHISRRVLSTGSFNYAYGAQDVLAINGTFLGVQNTDSMVYSSAINKYIVTP